MGHVIRKFLARPKISQPAAAASNGRGTLQVTLSADVLAELTIKIRRIENSVVPLGVLLSSRDDPLPLASMKLTRSVTAFAINRERGQGDSLWTILDGFHATGMAEEASHLHGSRKSAVQTVVTP